MSSLFQPNEPVEVNLCYGNALSVVTGRVVAFNNPGSDDGRHWIYTVLLDAPIPGYEWPAISVPGGMIRKIPPLKQLAREG